MRVCKLGLIIEWFLGLNNLTKHNTGKRIKMCNLLKVETFLIYGLAFFMKQQLKSVSFKERCRLRVKMQ